MEQGTNGRIIIDQAKALLICDSVLQGLSCERLNCYDYKPLGLRAMRGVPYGCDYKQHGLRVTREYMTFSTPCRVPSVLTAGLKPGAKRRGWLNEFMDGGRCYVLSSIDQRKGFEKAICPMPEALKIPSCLFQGFAIPLSTYPVISEFGHVSS
ncbi:unnamed protein product [Dovyalis caffra]|uniref:Uncharacterized protein n=1 Tax=Dovyalis caffra TaxID=77055 RepID=A0AAV1R895_9ROSI|nr:unnamed protein product [Dovyalis caffra]